MDFRTVAVTVTRAIQSFPKRKWRCAIKWSLAAQGSVIWKQWANPSNDTLVSRWFITFFKFGYNRFISSENTVWLNSDSGMEQMNIQSNFQPLPWPSLRTQHSNLFTKHFSYDDVPPDQVGLQRKNKFIQQWLSILTRSKHIKSSKERYLLRQNSQNSR